MINVSTIKQSLVITPIASEIEEAIEDHGSLEELLDCHKSLFDVLESSRYIGNGYEIIDGSFLSRFINSHCQVIGDTEYAYYIKDSACRDLVYELLAQRVTLIFEKIGEYGQDDDGSYYPEGDIPQVKEILPIIPRELDGELELFLPTQIDSLDFVKHCDSFFFDAGGYQYSTTAISRLNEGKAVELDDPRIEKMIQLLVREYWSDETDLEFKLLKDFTPRLLSNWQEYRFWNLPH